MSWQAIFFTGPPTINFISNPQIAFEGNQSRLQCNATNDKDAIDSLQIIWYKTKGKQAKINGQKKDLNKTDNNIISELNSTLLFSTVNYTDHGEYTCQAFNHPQSYTELQTNLTVECKVQ